MIHHDKDMPTMISRGEKFALLATLYLSQGLPFGFFVQALPVLLREQGLSLPKIGLTSLLALPWALKFLWAPVVDAAPDRRPVIVGLQLASAALMGLVALIDPAISLSWLLLAVLATNLLAATQDIATDGLAVKLLSFDERGAGNGIQVAAYRVGMILGGGVLLVLFHHAGWAWTFVALAGLLGVASVPIVLYRKEQIDPIPLSEAHDEPHKKGIEMRMLLDFLKRPSMLHWLGVLVAYKAGESVAGGMLRPFLVDRGLGTDEIGWLLGGAGFTAGLLGAALGGYGVTRMGRWRALYGFGVLQVIGQACYAVVATGWGGDVALWGAVCVEHLTGGMATAALFTMMMDVCEERSAGTDYTIMASVVVMTVGVGQALSGFVAKELGYVGMFCVAMGAAALGMVVIGALQPRAASLWRSEDEEKVAITEIRR